MSANILTVYNMLKYCKNCVFEIENRNENAKAIADAMEEKLS